MILLASIGEAVGQSLPFAVGIAASPPPVILAVLILVTGADEVVAFVVFLVIASLGVALPVAVSVALGDRAAGILEPLEAWLIRNNALIMGVLLLLIGVTLIGDAIAGFST